MSFKNEGFVIVLSSPSGGGKSSIAEVLSKEYNFKLSISYTTRAPRSKEMQDLEYYFTCQKDFLSLIKQDFFIEYTRAYGFYYGTPRKFIEETIKNGEDIVLNLDIHGMRSIKRNIKAVVTIFILPPSLKILKQRLLDRGDKNSTIKKRLESATQEIQHAKEYDYVLVNKDFFNTLELVNSIIEAEKVKNTRVKKLEESF